MGELRRLGRVVIASGGATPGFCRCADGTLLVSMRTNAGGWAKGTPRVSVTRSTDGGRTWSEPGAVAGDDGADGRQYISHVGLTCLGSGEVLLPYRDLGPEEACWLIRSFDSGLSWSAPEKLAPAGTADAGERVGMLPYGNIRELSNGDVIMPVAGEMAHDRAYRHGGYLRSKDGGKTWTEYNDACSGADGVADEKDVVELDNGDLIAVHRSWQSAQCGHGAALLYQTRSEDGGFTWTKPYIAQEATLGHSPALFKLKSGRILCAHRYLDDLDMGLSGTGFKVGEPDGTHWEGFSRVIALRPGRLGWGATKTADFDGRHSSGYPAIDWIDDERFMIVYQHKVGVHTPRDIEGAIYVEED